MSAADGEANLALAPYSRRISHIGLLGNVATLLGLLGTIFGLTTAFAAVGAADPSQRSAFLAAGISQALNTTAFGLIVAVPALMVHGFLVARVEAIAEQVDEVCVRLVRAMVQGGSAPAQAAQQAQPGPEASHAGAARPAAAAARTAGAR
jgi:biopolymer transport protein ExbB/TolQ